MIAFVDGALSRDAVIPADLGGILQGDGVFETLRVCGGHGFRLAAHLRRLRRGLEACAISPPAQLDQVDRMIAALARATEQQECLARITVVRRQPPAAAWWMLHLRPLPPAAQRDRDRREGVCARVSRVVHAPFPGPRCKSLSFQPWALARREAEVAGAAEALLTNHDGHLVEGAWSNLFWIEGESLQTPPLSLGALPGTTRAFVLEQAAARGWRTGNGIARPSHLWRHADEAFLTSAGRGILPLVRIDGQPIGTGRPGPRTAELAATWEEALAASRARARARTRAAAEESDG